MNRSPILFAALAAFATAGTIAAPAYAAETAPVAQVHFADLNLANGTGATELKGRVERAARRVCADAGDSSLKGQSQIKACRTNAVAQAMPQVELALAKAGTQVADAGRVSAAAK